MGRKLQIDGDKKNVGFVLKVSLFKWLRRRAEQEKTVPSVIVNRALASERARIEEGS